MLLLASNGYAEACRRAGGTRAVACLEAEPPAFSPTGGSRDFAELELYHLAIYCRGETPAVGRRHRHPVRGEPSGRGRRGGCRPGDYVFADASGAAVIPAGAVRCCTPPSRSCWRTRAPSPPSEAKPQTCWEAVETDWLLQEHRSVIGGAPAAAAGSPDRAPRSRSCTADPFRHRRLTRVNCAPGSGQLHPMGADSGQ